MPPDRHNDRCASLLGQGCDCRSPWDDEDDSGAMPDIVDVAATNCPFRFRKGSMELCDYAGTSEQLRGHLMTEHGLTESEAIGMVPRD